MTIDASRLLYSIIDEIGRERIRVDICSNIRLAAVHSEEIMTRFAAKLGRNADEETLAGACEALLHFMLTASLQPSQRKLSLNGLDLDIVIPSGRLLATDPEKSLVIQVIKKAEERTKIATAERVQPMSSNIWLVSASKLTTDYKNYNLGDHSYPSIVVDIDAFVRSKGVSGLRLLQ